jgi:hypothetical protein
MYLGFFTSKRDYCFKTNNYGCSCQNSCKNYVELENIYPILRYPIIENMMTCKILNEPTLYYSKVVNYKEVEFRLFSQENNKLYYEEV